MKKHINLVVIGIFGIETFIMYNIYLLLNLYLNNVTNEMLNISLIIIIILSVMNIITLLKMVVLQTLVLASSFINKFFEVRPKNKIKYNSILKLREMYSNLLFSRLNMFVSNLIFHGLIFLMLKYVIL